MINDFNLTFSQIIFNSSQSFNKKLICFDEYIFKKKGYVRYLNYSLSHKVGMAAFILILVCFNIGFWVIALKEHGLPIKDFLTTVKEDFKKSPLAGLE
jgi:hypothetical protein